MEEKLDNKLLTLYSEVRSEPVKWLWYPYIAIGKITLLQGDPGDGKSTMMMNLIAEISKGGASPDGRAFGRPRRVIYQCSEDGVADTIKPRLEKSCADCSNVAFINEEIYSGLTLDDERIRDAIISFRPSLVIIDPLQAYIGNGSDLQIAGKSRKLMSRLGLWASMYDVAVVLIGHMNKKTGGKELYRGLGSIDVMAAARSVLQVERTEKNPSVRMVKQIKNSLGPSDSEFYFEITKETGFRWLESEADEEEYKKEEPLRIQALEDIKEITDIPIFQTKLERAAYLMKCYLEQGDMASTDIYQKLSQAGIGHKTAEDARKLLGIKCYRKMRRWYWSLPRTKEILNNE
ncbi:MAG: AAA family ATPase [Hespellia sp.]|nr:AAA family ATPase [Hespellia sp.]